MEVDTNQPEKCHGEAPNYQRCVMDQKTKEEDVTGHWSKQVKDWCGSEQGGDGQEFDNQAGQKCNNLQYIRICDTISYPLKKAVRQMYCTWFRRIIVFMGLFGAL